METNKAQNLDMREDTTYPDSKSNSSLEDGRDKGWAWVVLTANFIVQFLITGTLSSLGVYLVEWEKQLTAPVSLLSWLIGLIFGLASTAGPIGSALSKVFSVRQVVIGGSIVTVLSFIVASFTSELWYLYLIFTIAGLGIGVIYQVSFVINVYYFDKLLGRANGIAQAGAGIGIFAMQPLLQVLIDTYGWQGSFLVMASVFANLAVCGTLFRSTPLEQENKASQSDRGQTQDDSETKNGHSKPMAIVILSVLKAFDFKLFGYFYFNLLLMGYVLVSFSYTIVIQYLPSRATSTGISELKAASLVSALGIGSLVSRLTHGFIIDYNILSTSSLTALSLLTSGLVTVFYPVSDNYWGLIVISAIAGLASGVHFSTILALTKEYVGVENVSGGIGLMNLVQGVSAFLALYLTGILVDRTNSYDIPFYLAGVMFFCGSVLLLVHPLRQYIQHRHDSDDRNIQAETVDNYLHGVENAAVDADCREC